MEKRREDSEKKKEENRCENRKKSGWRKGERIARRRKKRIVVSITVKAIFSGRETKEREFDEMKMSGCHDNDNMERRQKMVVHSRES